MARKIAGPPQPLKKFSLEEANRALPLVRSIVRDIVERYRRIQDLIDRMDHADVPSDLRERLEAENEELMSNLSELCQLGVELKSFELGLVDFYSERDGRGIFLCWKLGEDKIAWWHSLDEGYSGRRPIFP